MAAKKVAEVMKRVINSDTSVNIFLVGAFSVLALRSWDEQKLIEALEAENTRAQSTNKSLKKKMWDWKQQLYAEASSDSAVVPLSRLKAIYGDVVVPPPSDDTASKTEQSAPKLVI